MAQPGCTQLQLISTFSDSFALLKGGLLRELAPFVSEFRPRLAQFSSWLLLGLGFRV